MLCNFKQRRRAEIEPIESRLLLSTAVPTNGLQAYWKLDESGGTIAYDSSGAQANATAIGTPTWQPNAGMVDGSVLFPNSSTTYLDAGNLTSSDTSLSVALWARAGQLAIRNPLNNQ